MVEQALSIAPDGHSANAGMEHITMDELREKGHVPLAFHRDPENHPFQPFASGAVPTPSGKVELYSDALAQAGLDPLPGFVPPAESRWSEAAKSFPLEFLPRKNDNYMNSTFANLEGHRRMEANHQHQLEMHPADAAQRGIADADPVRVFNDRGSLELTARIHPQLPLGVVAGRLDWAKLNPKGSNVNVLTSERLTDMGRAPTFYSTLVQVVKANV